MENLKKLRVPLRAKVTRLINEISGLLQEEHIRREILEARRISLVETYQSLKEKDQKIIEEMCLGDSAPADIETESISCDDYENKFQEVLQRIVISLTPPLPEASEAGSGYHSEYGRRRTFKLPKIELRKFNGELKEWLAWWSQFEKIHNDESLHDSDKVQYLVQSMIVGTRARELVDCYPHSADNYPRIIMALKERFGNEKLLKQVYVRELLKLVIENNTHLRGKITVSQLFDRLECHLRALETLGVNSEQMAVFLFPMVESSLPDDLLIAWQRSSLYVRDEENGDAARTDLQCLMDFLRKEVEAEGQRTLAKAGFGIHIAKREKGEKPKAQEPENRIPTAAGLFLGQGILCVFCDKSHDSQLCITAQGMSMKEKKIKIQNKKACFTCLRLGHQAKRCKTSVRCLVCQRKHVALMCPSLHKTEMPDVEQHCKPAPGTLENVQATFSSPCSDKVILQTFQVILVGEKTRKQVRVLVDTGSQRSYILKKTVSELGLKPVAEETLCHVLFGGSRETKSHKRYAVKLEKIGGGFARTFELVDQDKICGTIPRVQKGPWMKELKRNHIYVNDIGDDAPEIELLLGSDFIGEIMVGRNVKLQNGLTSVQTHFGWTLMGKVNSPEEDESVGMVVMSMFISEARVPELWRLETIGIQDPVERYSIEEKEQLVRQHFEKTVSRSSDGRYCVCLPWIDGAQKIPDNRTTAEKRLSITTNKLLSSGHYGDYNEVFHSWLLEGIIEEVPTPELHQPAYYLPHRAVIKPESATTPVRPVFDASCKTHRSPSLNDCLQKGPNLLEHLPTHFLRFREGRIGVTADIRQAFLQVEIEAKDRDYLRFLWWDSEVRDKYRMFRHKRVVFGVNCSPFLLGAVIDHHLRSIEQDPEMSAMVATAQKLRSFLYVDNCVASVDSLEQLLKFKKEATSLLMLAKMQLRQWDCGAMDRSIFGRFSDTEDELFSEISTEQEDCASTVLGLKWNKTKDLLSVNIIQEQTVVMSKRNVLSIMSKIFDPIGFLCPALIEPKLIIQEAWACKSNWDEELQEDLKVRFQKWWSETPVLSDVCIPRNVTGGLSARAYWQIHTFCDASKYAYAAAVYLKTDDGSKVSVQLLQAKARVAPLKKLTIPRMELLACTIGARLTKFVQEALNITNVPTTLWSDSTTALSWIRRNDNWGTFVGNRVRDICKLTNPCNWRHVPGALNPADLPSRGCSPKHLLESRWWEGPRWLYATESEWPSEEPAPNEQTVSEERKLVVATTLSVTNSEAPWYGRRFSSFRKNIRVVAWIRRFAKLSSEQERMLKGDITVAEYNEAEQTVLKLIQKEVFGQAKEQNVISGLRVICTEDGLIRVKTKLVYRDDTFGFRLPVLLPNSHLMVKLLIRQEHEENGHAGVQFLMGKIRERYWILQSRRAIKTIVATCVRCQRFAKKSVETVPAPLPENRVKNAKVFEIIGVDLAGPLFLVDGSKSWIVLFTCAVYRCVHLELVTSLSTESFMWALTRFIKRRGRPSIIYSDNATNFVGTHNAFSSLDRKGIVAELQVQNIQWKFNPPSAPWWGGWWERLIRTIKGILKRILGRSSLSYQQLMTVLCEAEAMINGRPLTCVNEDQCDLIPLTPAMFLQEIQNVDFPELDAALQYDLRAKYRHVKKLKEELRSRFRKEYLSLLVQKAKEKKTRELNVGDIVLVETENKRRLDWPLAKVVELFPGKDKIVRVAKVKTLTGFLVRPLQRLYALEFQSPSDTPRPETENSSGCPPDEKSVITRTGDKTTDNSTRSGRKLKVPARYGHTT